MKYLLKTVDAGEKLNKEVDLFGTTEINELEQTQQQHQETAQRVDAYRSLWGINAGQLPTCQGVKQRAKLSRFPG